MSIAKVGLGIMLGATALFGQKPTPLSFEVASIRPSPNVPLQGVAVGAHVDGSQIRTTYLTLKDYVGMAYRLKLYQISGPDWIGTDRFDISASLPRESLPAQFPSMMQTLLAERS